MTAPRIQSPAHSELRRFIDHVPALGWSALPDGSLEYVNQRFPDYTGLSPDELYGSGWKSAIHRDDIQALESWSEELLQSREAGTTEVRLRRFDGSYRWFLVFANPLGDESGSVVAWYGTNIDIEDRKQAEEALRASELSWRQIIDNIPGFVNVGTTAEPTFFNRTELEYFGKTNEELKEWARIDVIHPEDLPGVIEAWATSTETGQMLDIEARFRRADGVYRWFQMRVVPARDAEGKISDWYALHTDIDDRKRAEEMLRQSEAELRTIIDTIRQPIGVLAPDGTNLYANRAALDSSGLTLDDAKEGFLARICHPDDINRVRDERRTGLLEGVPFDVEMRLLHKSGQYRWYLMQYDPLKDESGQIIRWYNTATDIDDQKRKEERLRQEGDELRTITDAIRQPIIVLVPDGTTLYANRAACQNTGLTVEELINEGNRVSLCHPDDRNRGLDERRVGLLEGVPFDLEMRVLHKTGQYRWNLMQYNPLKDESGQIIRWYVTATDIDDQKRKEERLRQEGDDLRTITDAIRQPILVMAPDGTRLYANRVACERMELTPEEVIKETFAATHPDEVNRVRDERRAGLLEGVPFDLEMRILFRDGKYRWQLLQYNPLKDESGQIIRWYATATDIDDQKRKEERLRNENVILREEIDRSSMFEEIVASCKPMRQVLKQVEKVATTDSTVLILGETGTGKELIARALHRKSKRAARAFIRVNCAAIPQSLIASELFGHEKGAFTGALQRRLGRFEAADGGTLFLDEIGDLPMETQIALLRVLQEKEFERVGSNHPVSVDVRLIAATNRDLPTAVAAGTFRQDLFYRLNVVPIDVPPLRERVDDISLLVEYFVGRFAKEAGKNIRHIGKHTLEQLESYHWPGNIRELQNVVERAVVLCETETFVVDESWLKRESTDSPRSREDLSVLADREVEMIETALAETHGRISGPSGAAAKLGIPRQTLESKIRRFRLDKYGRKRPS
jgi:formate hydrogenlyase transcriptional activator